MGKWSPATAGLFESDVQYLSLQYSGNRSSQGLDGDRPTHTGLIP